MTDPRLKEIKDRLERNRKALAASSGLSEFLLLSRAVEDISALVEMVEAAHRQVTILEMSSPGGVS